MRVAAGHDRCARWRAERGGVEVVVAEPALRERVDVGRLDETAEAAELREARVVEENQDDVWSLVGRRGVRRGPPFHGVLVALRDLALEVERRGWIIGSLGGRLGLFGSLDWLRVLGRGTALVTGGK